MLGAAKRPFLQRDQRDFGMPNKVLLTATPLDADAPSGTERRREGRERVTGGKVTIDGKICRLNNWSSSGFEAGSYGGCHEVGDKVPISFSVGIAEGTQAFECQAIIVRVDLEIGSIAGAFVHLDRADRVKLAEYFD
jgi:hypothetical protein